MAASAAVIGRQLRQQASSSRISGPVVPPTQYKGSGSSARAAAAEAAAAALSRARPSSFSSSGRQGTTRQGQGHQSSNLARTSSFYGALDTSQHAHQLGGSHPTVLSSSSLFLNNNNNTGADADKNFAKFSQLYSHEFYPHPAHRAEAAAALAGDGRGDGRRGKKRTAGGGAGGDKKSSTRRVFFSSRCWWVAVKAHCPGVILVLVGTIMSVVGFYAEALSEVAAVRLKNGTMVERHTDDSLKAQLHNLTYVGPVIMGLGGMVLVAACVLTFEVRDTLGVQMAAVQPTEHSPPGKGKTKEKVAAEDGRKKQRTKRTEVAPGQQQQQQQQQPGKRAPPPSAALPTAPREQPYPVREQPTSSVKQQHHQANGYPPNTYSSVNLAGAILQTDPQLLAPLGQSDQEVSVIQIRSSTGRDLLEEEKELGSCSATPTALISPASSSSAAPVGRRYQQHNRPPPKSSSAHYYSSHGHPPPVRQHSTCISVSTSDLFSIDMSFVRIPSPADTELSDPEGCSLHTLTSASAHSLAAYPPPFPSRWKSRCSCSGSPTNSMVLALQDCLEGSPAPAAAANHQWLSTSAYPPQLPHRYSKILASVESDGLSASTASSEWDIRGGGNAPPVHLLTMRRSSATISSESSSRQQQTQQQQQQQLFYGASSGRKASRGSLGLPVNSHSHNHSNSLYNSSLGYPLLELPTPTSPHT